MSATLRQGEEGDRPSRVGAPSLRVLVGDADEATLDLLQSMLELQGCQVAVARSGPELIAAAINELPHLVIFEGRLPGMDGWSVCDVLSHVMEDTPLVFLSTQSGTGDFARAKESGASCCIPKPFRMADLLKIIEPLAADLERVSLRDALRGVDASGA
jgi:CheY-like chemotaxis protein